MKENLQIGVIIDDSTIPAWSYKMLEIIHFSSNCKIVLVIKNKTQEVNNKSFIKKITTYYKSSLFTLVCKLDKVLNKFSPDAFEPKDIKNLLSVDEIEINLTQTKFSNQISEYEIEKIKNTNLDILINLSFKTLSGNILKAARYGIWSLHHGDHEVNLGCKDGMWDVLQNWKETGVILKILTENHHEGIIIKKLNSSSDSLSINRNKNNYYWKALSLLPLKIEELYKIGEEEFFKRTETLNLHPQFYSKKPYATPSNTEMLYFGSKLLFKKIKNKIQETFYFNQWILLFKLNPSQTASSSFSDFKKILPPKNKFWADPHIIKRDGKYYIFIEELIYSQNKGFISFIEMDEQGNYKDPVKVLEKDYHLSYPYLIEDNGELYMIPETKQNNSIELYKCAQFPHKWELEMTLMDNVRAVDSTILFKDNKYWLFCNITRGTGTSSLDELFLYSSDKLVSNKWTSHPQNPIISDIKQSRPAGNFFMFKNKLYRPSQNGSKHYGYAMKINHVVQLTEKHYEENTVDEIFPNWDHHLKSTHTINSVDHLTVIDALMRRRK
ncbi:glucosamine inositolphosphorylceramide transferase family protein [Pedobacter cryophilus]|uniref:Glucosamine inositolphosphorylceramide transferase 1 N-terminal domain-containing protein n=1 Tax=Pedobacter cryophilus TaxID=2571271 RepID=A0A4U1C1P8_9SPHI|nr:hypothetical protein [Pedobacter cryophilus]TKB98907.1 hypothetical protein FA046_07270 [Pedobacter cryophilus]